jgi:hypothetical protein
MRVTVGIFLGFQLPDRSLWPRTPNPGWSGGGKCEKSLEAGRGVPWPQPPNNLMKNYIRIILALAKNRKLERKNYKFLDT